MTILRFLTLILLAPETGGEPAAAAAAAPAASPAAAAPASPDGGSEPPAPVEGGDDVNPFLGALAEGGDDFESIIPAEPAAPAPGEPATPATPAAPAPPVPPVVAATPGAIPPPAPAPAPTAEPAAPAAPFVLPSDPVELARVMDENRVALIDGLAQQRFNLSEDEKLAIETDAVAAIPKLLARVYHEAMTTMYHQMGVRVPQMVNTFMQASAAHRDLEDQFYSKFPALDRGKHKEDVVQALNVIKGLNPKIGQDDLWSLAAATVTAKLGLVAPAPGNGTQPPGGAATFRQPPFQPATPGGPATRVVVKPEDNPWAGALVEAEET